MASVNPIKLWQAFLALPNTSHGKTMGVAFLVALVCSIAVSLTAVTLKPLQDLNRLRESTASMGDILDSLGVGLPDRRWIARVSGDYVKRESATKSELNKTQDIAGLGTVEDVVPVYEWREGGRLELVILPVRGVGYKSMMHGYLALEYDLNTIAALSFYQQDETPGMGARITEKDWQSLWGGKMIADENGNIRIRVAKGAGTNVNEVDGISGATRTGTGVTNLLQFWLGPDGYGPYLNRIKRGDEG